MYDCSYDQILVYDIIVLQSNFIFSALPGFTIHVDFRGTFNIEPSTECSYDFLEFRDGPFGYSRLIGTYCGNEFPPVIKSSSRFLWIRFKSDKNLGDLGFRALYSFVQNNSKFR